MAGRMTRSMLTTTVNTQQVMDTLAHLINSSCMSTCCTTWKGTWNKRERQFLYQRCHSIVDARHSAAFVRLQNGTSFFDAYRNTRSTRLLCLYGSRLCLLEGCTPTPYSHPQRQDQALLQSNKQGARAIERPACYASLQSFMDHVHHTSELVSFDGSFSGANQPYAGMGVTYQAQAVVTTWHPRCAMLCALHR